MVIPDVVNGFTNGGANFINVNTIISAASSFYILLYMIVLIGLLRYAFGRFIKTSFLERLGYMFAILVLAVIYCYHYYSLVDGLVNAINSDKDVLKKAVAMGVEFLFIIGFVLFVSLTYILYYKPRLASRLKSHAKHQAELDHQFRLMDG
jgi:amino acid transporter